jgi:hypothetical protein
MEVLHHCHYFFLGRPMHMPAAISINTGAFPIQNQQWKRGCLIFLLMEVSKILNASTSMGNACSIRYFAIALLNRHSSIEHPQD